MRITLTGVIYAANLSLFRVNVAYRLQADVRQREPDYSILALKADDRGNKCHTVTGLDRIHPVQLSGSHGVLAKIL